MASGPHPTATAAAATSSSAAAPSAGGSSSGTTTTTTTTSGGILIGDRLYSEVSLTIDHSLIPEERLSPTPSMQDGLDLCSETDLRILGCELIQAAGILLRLPQVGARARAAGRASSPRSAPPPPRHSLPTRCRPAGRGPDREGPSRDSSPRVPAGAGRVGGEARLPRCPRWGGPGSAGERASGGGTKWRRRLVRARLTLALPLFSLVCRWRWQRGRCCSIGSSTPSLSSNTVSR